MRAIASCTAADGNGFLSVELRWAITPMSME